MVVMFACSRNGDVCGGGCVVVRCKQTKKNKNKNKNKNMRCMSDFQQDSMRIIVSSYFLAHLVSSGTTTTKQNLLSRCILVVMTVDVADAAAGQRGQGSGYLRRGGRWAWVTRRIQRLSGTLYLVPQNDPILLPFL